MAYFTAKTRSILVLMKKLATAKVIAVGRRTKTLSSIHSVRAASQLSGSSRGASVQSALRNQATWNVIQEKRTADSCLCQPVGSHKWNV